jgi:hypothetical protein
MPKRRYRLLAAVEALYGEAIDLKVEPRLDSEIPPITEV